MKKDYLKSMFDFIKGLGGFTQYKDFEEYNSQKFGITKEPTISEKVKDIPLEELEEFAEKLPKEKRERFEDTLIGKERKQYLEMFEASEE